MDTDIQQILLESFLLFLYRISIFVYHRIEPYALSIFIWTLPGSLFHDPWFVDLSFAFSAHFDLEGRALSQGAVHCHLPSHQFYHSLAYRQPEASALLVLVGALCQFPEVDEQILNSFLGDPPACVGDVDSEIYEGFLLLVVSVRLHASLAGGYLLVDLEHLDLYGDGASTGSEFY